METIPHRYHIFNIFDDIHDHTINWYISLHIFLKNSSYILNIFLFFHLCVLFYYSDSFNFLFNLKSHHKSKISLMLLIQCYKRNFSFLEIKYLSDGVCLYNLQQPLDYSSVTQKLSLILLIRQLVIFCLWMIINFPSPSPKNIESG